MAVSDTTIKKSCLIDGCDKKIIAQGYCNNHYRKARLIGAIQKRTFPLICSVENCGKPSEKRGFCELHYRRFMRHGSNITLRQNPGCITNHGAGYHMQLVDGGEQKLLHVIIAEKALGKKLPKGAIIHHVDENKRNNAGSNLVICPDRAYHNIIHARMRARSSCGNANWKKCGKCKKYDDPLNMKGRSSRNDGNINSFTHIHCK